MAIQGFRTEEVLRRNQPYWLSGAEWKRIGPLMPRGRRGAHRPDDRRVISWIVHMLRPGALAFKSPGWLYAGRMGNCCWINMFNSAITK